MTRRSRVYDQSSRLKFKKSLLRTDHGAIGDGPKHHPFPALFRKTPIYSIVVLHLLTYQKGGVQCCRFQKKCNVLRWL
jgi:hypothetical protein